MSAISANLSIMIAAAEKAARSLARDFSEVEKLQISVKGPGDFVSRADKRSEEIIVESLQKDRPDWGIMAEEGTAQRGKDEQYRFIIDPLDGTRNFLHGLPHWAITIALEKNGEIISGITYDPVRDEMFRVEKNVGAFMNNSRLRVSGRKEMSRAMIVMDTLLTDEVSVKSYQESIIRIESTPGATTRVMGSAALDLAYVAAGRFDAYYMQGGVKSWDIATGILLVREATGVVTDLKLTPAHHSNKELLAGNAAIHKSVADLIGLKA